VGDTARVDLTFIRLMQGLAEQTEGLDITKMPNGGLNSEWLDPDAVFDLGQMALPDEAVWEGREAISEGWQRWLDQWDDYRVTASNAEIHGDRILLDIHAEARGRGSGVPISVAHAQVWTLRGRLILRIQVYANRAQALEALSREAPGDGSGPRTPPAP
jgi:hypothetical protein